jgi:hypothetical protein
MRKSEEKWVFLTSHSPIGESEKRKPLSRAFLPFEDGFPGYLCSRRLRPALAA